MYNIDHLEPVYVAACMHDKFLWDKKEMMRHKIQDERFESRKALTVLEDPKSDTSGSVNEDSETEPEPESLSPQSTHLKKSVSKPQGHKRDPFVVTNTQRKIGPKQTQGFLQLWTKWTHHFISLCKEREVLQHFMWGTWNSTPARKACANRLTGF